jgi:hypothetical protein
MATKLPATYIAARQALATCARVDECKKWVAKADALKAYAKQMKDGRLEADAQRIRNRAIQRAGELLAQIESERGKRRKSLGGHSSARQTIAKQAGLTPKQAKTAVEVAKVEKKLADDMIEANPPATVKQLAAAGRKKRTTKANKPKPAPYRNEWAQWTDAIDALSALPACGLQVLAERNPEEIPELLTQCDDAISNLKLWKHELENANGSSKARADKSARTTVVAL